MNGNNFAYTVTYSSDSVAVVHTATYRRNSAPHSFMCTIPDHFAVHFSYLIENITTVGDGRVNAIKVRFIRTRCVVVLQYHAFRGCHPGTHSF